MKWHKDCRYMELPRDYSVEELAKFHGHLGSFIVLGYRIGRSALESLGGNPFDISANVYCSGQTPQSCLIDGIQLGSGCTFGKRNIDLIISDTVKVVFRHTDGRQLTFLPGDYEKHKSEYSNLDEELAFEKLAEAMYHMQDAELFSVVIEE